MASNSTDGSASSTACIVSPCLDGDLISAGEARLRWLKRQADLLRIETASAKLSYAIEQARQGDLQLLRVILDDTDAAEVAPDSASFAAIDRDARPAIPQGQSSSVRSTSASTPATSEIDPIPQHSSSSARTNHGVVPAAVEEPLSTSPAKTANSPTWDGLREHAQAALLKRKQELRAASESKAAIAQVPNSTRTKPSQTSSPTKSLEVPTTDTSLGSTKSKPVRSSQDSPSRKSSPPRDERLSLLSGHTTPVLESDKISSLNSLRQWLSLRWKSTPAWIVSLASHALLLMVLMLITLQLPASQKPLELSPSPVETEIASLEISPTTTDSEIQDSEVSEPTTDPSEILSTIDAPSISSASLPQIDSGQFASQPSDVVSALSGGTASPAGMISSAQFFGAKAAGNTFCYVVDSSASMRGEPFLAAKSELLRSISSLKESQRFYIVFFHDELQRLTLNPGNAAEPKPVSATRENIEQAARWMEGVHIGKGAPPVEALELAISLEPDGVFLLTDGITKVDVAAELRRINRIEDEIDGSSPLCAVHTLGFYSQEGETLLERIAMENGGVYRYVPDPTPRKPR